MSFHHKLMWCIRFCLCCKLCCASLPFWSSYQWGFFVTVTVLPYHGQICITSPIYHHAILHLAHTYEVWCEGNVFRVSVLLSTDWALAQRGLYRGICTIWLMSQELSTFWLKSAHAQKGGGGGGLVICTIWLMSLGLSTFWLKSALGQKGGGAWAYALFG